jgi:hypothetical protein
MEVDKITEQNFKNVDKFLGEVIKPIFPKARFMSSFMCSSPDELATSFQGQLSPMDLFKDSVYEYQGDYKFLHFTNLFALKSILESGFLRMSEFSNLLDTNEIHYATKVFQNSKKNSINEEEIENQKEKLFCLSLCESNENTKRDDFMWEVYADKGKGVLVEFEFTKPNPSRFVFGKVQYGKDKLKPLEKIVELSEKFKDKNQNFFPNNFTELFIDIFSFHKVKKFEAEKEVRMLLKVEKHKYEEHTFESVYRDINNKLDVKYFNKLFLKGRHPYLELNYPFSDDVNQVFNEFPQVEIKNIVFGYGLSIEKKVDLRDLFCKIRNEYKYEYQISQINDEGEIIEM